MKKNILWILLLVCICILASCGNSETNDNIDCCKVTKISVEGDLVKHDKVNLSNLTYGAFNENLEETISGENEANVSKEESITYSALNDTDEFKITIYVDNPTENSIAQLKLEVEGKVCIKNEKNEMAPFEDYNHGIINWIAQNASKETFTFKTEADAIVKIVGIKLVGETTWQTSNLGYNQLNIYKVEDTVDFVSNNYNEGYSFKTKNIEDVTVTAVTTDKTETVEPNKVYTMKKNGNIIIDYDLKINEDMIIHCAQSKSIEVVDIKIEQKELEKETISIKYINDDWNQRKGIMTNCYWVKYEITVNNIGTGNEKFIYELTDGINFWGPRDKSYTELGGELLNEKHINDFGGFDYDYNHFNYSSYQGKFFASGLLPENIDVSNLKVVVISS